MTTIVDDLFDRFTDDRPRPYPRAAYRRVALPEPPTDAQRDSYFGPQHRWVFLYFTLSFLCIAISVGGFAVYTGWYYAIPFVFIAAAALMSARTSTYKRKYSLAGHRATVENYRPKRYPSIDIFLPTAGEPVRILENTYSHVAQLEWPGEMVITILDDGANGRVAELAQIFGFNYHTRPDRPFMMKAGNLATGFRRTGNDFVVIFDADFAPRSDFLTELMPYTADETVGLVQSPQYFDTRSAMKWLQRGAGATQELFYRLVQPSRDVVGASICVGTSAIYRRTALDAIGGFPLIGHSEDVYTGVEMMKKDYTVNYVPAVLSTGLAPDSLHGFLRQQYRWCMGSMELMLDHSFHRAGLTRRQLLCFWSGFAYYLGTAAAVLFGLVPLIAMAWLNPRFIVPFNSVWMIPAVVDVIAVMPLLMRGRWRPEVLRVQMLYSYAHVIAIAHAFGGRQSAWVATNASNSQKSVSNTILTLARTWTFVTLLATWPRLIEETVRYGIANYWATDLLAFALLYVQLPVLASLERSVAIPLVADRSITISASS